MGTFRFRLKIERIGKPGDAADMLWKFVRQSCRANSIFQPDF